MKSKLHSLFSLFFVFAITIANAQEKTITGTVQDNAGLPLPGVNILVKNTNTGTQSDFDGNYSIKTSVGKTLVFSYIGFTPQEIVVTGATNNLNITLSENAATLDEVVVTALGIKKEKKALGYAVTTLGSEDIEQRANGDLTRILQGKAAGVDIISASGLSGAGSSVNIRGLTSTGNNQPLYVVDGVRFNSATNGTGFSGTSRFLDIDPNSIESVNVLKGLAASALYGSAGKNGVIVITTKAGKSGVGKKKTEVTVTASTVINEIANLPDYTNQRGQGYYDAFYNFFGNFGATFGNFGVGNVDSNGQVPHPYGLNSPVFQDAFPDLVGSRVDYRNYRSQEEFFETGFVQNYNVNVNGGGENTSFNVSLGNLADEGFLPGNNLRRTTFSAGGNANLTNKLNVSSVLNMSTSSFNSPFTGDIFGGLLNTPRSIDLAGFPSQHPVTGEEISFQNTISNPYWVINNTNIGEEVTRVFGNIGLSYSLTDNFTVSYKYGTDVSVEQREIFENRGNIAGDLGAFSTNTRRQTLTNHTMIGAYNNRFADDKIGLDFSGGVDIARIAETLDGANSTVQTVFGGQEHRFFEEQTAFSGEYAINTPGVFAQMTLDYENYLFITASARNDWTSNFVDNSQFYPGVGVSFIPTEAFEGLKSDVLSYFKVRGGYGTSADFNVPGNSFFGLFNPFPTFQEVGQNSQAFITADGENISINSIDNTLANRTLGPALIEEYEVGFESRFWKNRITLDATYFDRTTTGLIFDRQIDPSTGFNNTPRNVNELNVYGVEIEFNLKAIQSDDFSFDIGGNFTSNRTLVVELEEERFQVTGAAGGLGNYLVEGQPINTILGTVIATDENGNLLTDGRAYILAEDIEIIGDPNPDFILSTFGNIRYKNLNLSANFQYRSGGDIHSTSAQSLLGRGLTTDTDNLQNAGFILPGIDTTTGEPNEVVISSGDAFFNTYAGPNSSDQVGIFDASTIRLQELALTYRFDEKMLKNSPLGALSISLIGENLYFNAINIPDGLNIDTNALNASVNANGQGIESGISPTSRRFGFSVKASF